MPQITQDDQGRTFRDGVLQAHSQPGTPGIGGALQDLSASLGQGHPLAAMIDLLSQYIPGANTIRKRPSDVNRAVEATAADRQDGGPEQALGDQF